MVAYMVAPGCAVNLTSKLEKFHESRKEFRDRRQTRNKIISPMQFSSSSSLSLLSYLPRVQTQYQYQYNHNSNIIHHTARVISKTS
eukprot:scaffold9028_cov298-Chaetoceros_neogracile.AAC.3